MMRKYAFLIVAAVAVLALPSSASADYECPPPPEGDPPWVEDPPTGTWVADPTGTVPGYVHVYAGHSHYDWPDGTDPDIVIGGGCWETGGIDYGAGTFHGGSIEAAADTDDGTIPDDDDDGGSENPTSDVPGAYAIIDGDESNTDPSEESHGYIGISNYENSGSPATDDNCDNGTDDDHEVARDGGSNSGWCTYIIPAEEGIPTPIAGGADSGTYDDGPRDGWRIP